MKARWTLSLVCIGLTGLLALPVAQADEDGDDNSDSLVGTWRLTVTDPFGGGFISLISFHADNTVLERPSTSPSVSVGVGSWEAIGDDDDDSDSDDDSESAWSGYAVTFESFTDSDFDTNFDTRLRIRLTLEVKDDMIAGTGTVDVFSLDSPLLLASFSGAVLEGTRVTVIPE